MTCAAPPFFILGAGVAGLCVASELAARGCAIRIIDPNGVPAEHACSWWAGGMLAPYCEGETAEEPVTRLGQQAADWWQEQGVQVTRQGSLVVALGRDKAELERFARRTTGHTLQSKEQLTALEPDIAAHTRGGLYFAQEAHLDPRAALAHLVASLEKRKITIETAHPPHIPPNAQIIDCRGLTAQDQLTDLRGVKGEMLLLHCPDVTLRRPIRLLHPRIPLYIVPRGDGYFMLGATQIESADSCRATVRSVLELLSAAFALSPAFGEAHIDQIGVDARPAFVDNLPRIRRRKNVLYVNGLFRHGFLLAPALARMCADFILSGITPEVMDENYS